MLFFVYPHRLSLSGSEPAIDGVCTRVIWGGTLPVRLLLYKRFTSSVGSSNETRIVSLEKASGGSQRRSTCRASHASSHASILAANLVRMALEAEMIT